MPARSADGALRGERMAAILVRLREHGEVHATDLAAEFGVSQATLRRDLAILEEQGLCTRRYGGARITGGICLNERCNCSLSGGASVHRGRRRGEAPRKCFADR